MNLLIDTNVILNMAFNRSGCEDAVLLFKRIRDGKNRAFITAKSNRMDCIVTVNLKDFEDSSLNVLTPKECIKLL